jgi:hypothetical protein
MLEWNPERLHNIADLAAAFDIDLSVERSESTSISVSGKNPIYEKHPIWSHVEVTGINGDWTQIDCPNVENHSCADASGAAVLIRDDGSLAFHCHHGSCNGDSDTPKMTGLDIIKKLGIEKEVNEYIHNVGVEGSLAISESLGLEIQQAKKTNNKDIVIRDDDNFNLLRYIYIPPENKFYDICTKNMLPGDALNQLYLRTMPGGKDKPEKAANYFHKNRCSNLNIADAIGWVPFTIEKQSRDSMIIDFNSKRLVNSWTGLAVKPKSGDASPWLAHMDYLIPDEEQRKNVIQYLAFSLQKPNIKISYTILHRGNPGVGKDLMLVPIMRGFGMDSVGSVTVSQAIDGWGDHLARKKFILIEEVDKAQNRSVNNALKTLLAPTATGVRTINMKGGSVVTQLDCINTYMMSNKKNPISLERNDRRYYVVDSWIEKRGSEYYSALDDWLLKESGIEIAVDYLLNLDISNFQHNAPPTITAGMIEMQDSGRYDYEVSIEELINEKASPFQMSLFTLTTLKSEMKKHEIKCITNSLIEAVEDNYYTCIRGSKKIEGKTDNTPKFFVSSDNPICDGTKTEIFDYYVVYKNGGMP